MDDERGKDIAYRIALAEGFLAEAREDLGNGRWRSCVDNSQLAVENAAKAALALLGPVGRTHDPAPLLQQAVGAGKFAPGMLPAVEQLIECSSLLGSDVHAASDYGDDRTRQTPWQLFLEPDAQQAFCFAEKALRAVRLLVSLP